jgi:hypothetical protein
LVVACIYGGSFNDGVNVAAQLCVWDGTTLALENLQTWYWTSDTYVWSVGIGDVDGDAQAEIVTGGSYWDGSAYSGQLCVWSGTTLSFEGVQTWLWGGITQVRSVAVGDVDIDGKTDIVTGGYCSSGAQLCVWDGSSLAFENVKTWSWGSGITRIESVAVGNVDSDGSVEFVTGGGYNDGIRSIAQLCVWS